jgi:hypothetical protein
MEPAFVPLFPIQQKITFQGLGDPPHDVAKLEPENAYMFQTQRVLISKT